MLEVAAVRLDPPTTGSTGCSPGTGAIPDGVPGQVLCGTWISDIAAVAGWWPLPAAIIATALAVRLGWAALCRQAWRRHTRRAQWLEITPPATATPAATVQLWRLAATLLPVPRWWQPRPARLVWEVAANVDRSRCGLWVPPGISPVATARIVQRAWPGARIHHTPAPRLPAANVAVAAHRLIVTQPEWLPLLEDPPPNTPSRRSEHGADEQDRLRAVYDGLAAAGRTGYGLLQVHISRAPASRVAMLRRATTNARRAHRPNIARGLFAAASGMAHTLLDLLSNHPPSGGRNGSDPYTTQFSAAARTKLADPPHLVTAVYAAAAGPTQAAAQAACADITSGYGIFATHLARRRLRQPQQMINHRWTPIRRMTLVTVAEAAALASLPGEPAAYGLPQAAARRRPQPATYGHPSPDTADANRRIRCGGKPMPNPPSGAQTNRHRATNAQVLTELGRLTSRDRHLLQLLDEHRVLTTEHIAAIGFGSIARARSRLHLLHTRGVLDRFRHYIRPGSVSWRWTLGPLGAAVLAAARDQNPPRPAAVREATVRLAAWPQLEHLLAVNGFFVSLHAHARHRPDTHLTRWWSETQARRKVDGLVRPDGAGLWRHHHREVPFWLEHDTGTETLHKLASKLTDYQQLAGTGWNLPILIHLPNTTREANLRQRLAEASGIAAGLTIATTSSEHTSRAGPAGTVWQLAGAAARRALIDIPHNPNEQEGTPWDQPGR